MSVSFLGTTMTMTDIVITLLMGALAGFIAGKIMKEGFSLFGNIVVGVIGAILGQWVFNLIHLQITVGNEVIDHLIVAVIGSCILLFIINLFQKR